MAVPDTKKRSTRRPPAPEAKAAKARTAAARKGWETRKRRAEEEARRKRARAKARAAEKKRAAEEHARRSRAAKKGARTRKAKERAQAALETFHEAVRHRTREHELDLVRASWHKAKREVFEAGDVDLEDYLDILATISEATASEWDIAYAPEEAAS